MGLGNSYYAMGDLPAAERAFRETVDRHPTQASAYNNLAQVLLELGRRGEALQMAQRAVRIGGPFKHVYQQTLEQIRAGEGYPTPP
jgi:tetratricopeptide (TPR) repeat protein